MLRISMIHIAVNINSITIFYRPVETETFAVCSKQHIIAKQQQWQQQRQWQQQQQQQRQQQQR